MVDQIRLSLSLFSSKMNNKISFDILCSTCYKRASTGAATSTATVVASNIVPKSDEEFLCNLYHSRSALFYKKLDTGEVTLDDC